MHDKKGKEAKQDVIAALRAAISCHSSEYDDQCIWRGTFCVSGRTEIKRKKNTYWKGSPQPVTQLLPDQVPASGAKSEGHTGFSRHFSSPSGAQVGDDASAEEGKKDRL